jgi:hypothetical protein
MGGRFDGRAANKAERRGEVNSDKRKEEPLETCIHLSNVRGTDLRVQASGVPWNEGEKRKG